MRLMYIKIDIDRCELIRSGPSKISMMRPDFAFIDKKDVRQKAYGLADAFQIRR
jgi:hypothetical protein